MSDIHVTISGRRGVGKTTLAKRLFQLLANSEYYVEEVQDDLISRDYITNMEKVVKPRRRAPRTITIEVVNYGFHGVDLPYDEEEDED